MNILELREIGYTYRTQYQQVEALKGVSHSFETGKLHAIMGRSGSGKTTLLSLMAGLDLPTTGQVLFEGTSTAEMNLERYRREKAAVIYQNFRLFPLLTVAENVMYPMELRGMIRQIMEFQGEEETAFWSNSLYQFFPQLDRAYMMTLSFTDKKKYIDSVLRELYAELEDTINEKKVLYSQHWGNCKAQISEALSEAFEVDCSTIFNDLRCNVSMNPIMPRFLREHSFDVFYLNSERGAIGSSIHEIIHFVWFYVWNELFGDSYDEYERPSLKWILSEMVVESVMKDSRLSSINPYFPRKHGGCIYPYFFDMVVNDSLILDILDEMYRSQNIQEFMKTSYAYCRQHEAEIRSHIQKAENK